MAELPPLHQEIFVNATQALAAMEQVIGGLQAVGGTATATAAKVQTSTASMATGMFKTFAGFAAVTAIVHEMKAMKDEAVNLQVAGTRLDAALAGIGNTSKEAAHEIYASADAYASLGFQGSEAVNAMGTLITATGDVSQANKLLAMSADYARYKHIDMNTAATLLARATTGNVRALTQMGIVLDKNLPKNQAISKAFDELNKRIGGQATAYTKTLAGQIAILKEKFDNIAQTIGAAVVPVLTKMVEGLGWLVTYISNNAVALGIFGAGVLVVVGYLKLMALWEAVVAAQNPMVLIVAGVLAAGAAFAWLWNHLTIFRETVAETLATIIQLIGYLVGGVAKLIRLLSYLPGGGFLKGVAQQADKVAESIGKAAKSVDELKNKKVGIPSIPKLSDFVKPGDPTGIKGNASDATKSGTGGTSGTVQYVTVYASDTNDIARKMSKAAKIGLPIGGH